jgi:SAM-dependent methyltransferase
MQSNAVRALSIASPLSIYQVPQLYDVAFSYRDIPAEVHVITEWYLAVTQGKSLTSVLDLASGPANHALEYMRRGVKSTALDVSVEMLEYAADKARQRRLPLKTTNQDMVDFQLVDRFDLALLMLDSACHILNARDMIRHLNCVARHLNPGGLYVMELAKPVLKGHKPSLSENWRVSEHGTDVEVQWGSESDSYDTRRGIAATTVTMKGQAAGGNAIAVSETLQTKVWSQYAIEKAITTSGAFAIARRHGAFLSGCSNADANAWRLIYVLKKV